MYKIQSIRQNVTIVLSSTFRQKNGLNLKTYEDCMQIMIMHWKKKNFIKDGDEDIINHNDALEI